MYNLLDEDIGVEITDRYLGSIIERVIERNRFTIDVEDEYEGLLYYIYSKLLKLWFKNSDPTEEEFEERIRYVKRKKRLQLEILLSYLVSSYLRSKATLKVHSSRDNF